jgi:predicted nucleic acid-binding protein
VTPVAPEDILDRSLEFEKRGLSGMDAVHIACAEKAKADFFVTCDNRLIKKLQRVDNIEIPCYNIINFVSGEVFKK